jgi:hypothetical protein
MKRKTWAIFYDSLGSSHYTESNAMTINNGLQIEWLKLTERDADCMELSPSSEANRSSASQEIPRVLWNPKVEDSCVLRCGHSAVARAEHDSPKRREQIALHSVTSLKTFIFMTIDVRTSNNAPRRFITVFTIAHHVSLSWARSIQLCLPIPLLEDLH